MLSTTDTIIIIVIAIGIPLSVLFFGCLYNYLQKQHALHLLQQLQHQENKKSSSAISGNLVKEYSFVINILDHYRLSRILLGRGSSAEVFVGEQIRNRHRYAIKVIDLTRKEVIWRYEKEKNFLKDIEHSNVIRLFEIYNTSKKMFFVMELCTGGHLGQLLKKPTESNNGFSTKRDKRSEKGAISRGLRHESREMGSNDREEMDGIRHPNNPHHLSELQVREYILQITRAIIHCHNQGICHRDIKLQNILLENHSSDAQIKIIDFGNAVRFIGCTPLKKVVGTTYTAAPEVFRQEYDERCDIWSLGVITYILLSGRRPFERVEIDQTAKQRGKNNRKSKGHMKSSIPPPLTAAQKQVLPSQYHNSSEGSVIASILLGRYHFHHESFRYVSKEAISFVQFCMELDYKQRPYAKDLLNHPWLRSDFINTTYMSFQYSPRDSDLSPTDEASLPFTTAATAAGNSSRSHIGLMSMIPLISQNGMKTLIDSTSRHLKNPNFTGMRDASMLAIAFSMPIAKVKKLRVLFQEIDHNGNGLIGKKPLLSSFLYLFLLIFFPLFLLISCFS
jgi:serine/threonine protein kinase